MGYESVCRGILSSVGARPAPKVGRLLPGGALATAVLDSDPNNRPICSGAYSSAFATLGGMGCALVVLEREQKQYPHH